MEEGIVYETLNLASLKSLPILFLCENNGLASYTSIEDRQSFNIEKHVNSYGIEYHKIDEGYDFDKIYSVSKKVINEIRSQQQSIFLEIKTCRYKEHVGPNEDPEESRNIKEIDSVILGKTNDDTYKKIRD